jgi:dnd system-associated protein 4
MAPSRIKIAKDKVDLVKDLVDAKGNNGPFETYADLLVFAAALGIKYNKRVPIKEISKTEPAPIALEIFISRGYDWAIKLLAINATEDEKSINIYDSAMEEERITIFEEYANGGLEKLREDLRGSVDYTETLLLIINAARFPRESTEVEFDLSKFL